MKWKVGDKVRLTGTSWGNDPTDEYFQGAVFTITGVRGGNVRFETDGLYWGVHKGWEIELVERKEETMSVDFSEVNVGDKVRLTRENGDETTFTVERVAPGAKWADSKTNSYHPEEWDTLKIRERAFKPIPGLYTHHGKDHRFVLLPDGREYFTSATGSWVVANSSEEYSAPYQAVRENKSWIREITF